jgi:hypothetical protein
LAHLERGRCSKPKGGLTARRSTADSLRTRAFLVRARLDDADVEALAAHLEEAAERIEQLERLLAAAPVRTLWLH